MRNHDIFSITPVIPRILIVAIVVGIYYFLNYNHFFSDWIYYIDIAVKIISGYEVLRGSMYSLLAPILACVIGLAMMIAVQKYGIHLFMVSTMNGWELIIVSVVGMMITLIRLL